VKFDSKTAKLSTNNLQTVREHIKANTASLAYQGLLCVLADVLDRASAGNDTYVILGLTQNRDALLLTVKEGSKKAYAGGGGLLEISEDAEKLV